MKKEGENGAEGLGTQVLLRCSNWAVHICYNKREWHCSDVIEEQDAPVIHASGDWSFSLVVQ